MHFPLQLTAKGRLDARLMAAFSFLVESDSSKSSSQTAAATLSTPKNPDDDSASKDRLPQQLESSSSSSDSAALNGNGTLGVVLDGSATGYRGKPPRKVGADLAVTKAERAVGLRVAELLFGQQVKPSKPHLPLYISSSKTQRFRNLS